MRKILLLIQLSFCLSSNSLGFIITSATAEEFKKAQESNYNFFIDMNSIHKGNCLELLKQEISRCYTRKDDYEIEYVGWINEMNLCILKIIDYNNENLYLVNCKDYLIQKLLSNISISSSGYIATYDIPSGDNYRGIQIYRNRNGKIKLIETLKSKEWFPISMYWLNSDELIIKAKLFDDSNSFVYKRLKFHLR